MRRSFLILFFFLAGMGVYAQDGGRSCPKSFSLELGAGPGPVHTRMMYPSAGAFASEGKRPDHSSAIYPAVGLSGVWRVSPRWELILTGSLSWSHFKVTRYDVFGIDPKGNPRFDLSREAGTSWAAAGPIASLTFQGRVLWNPKWKVRLYSAFGLGFAPQAADIYPLPSITPVGARYEFSRLYLFTDCTLGPVSTALYSGLGWHF